MCAGGGGSHWLMIYGDAQRLKGAFVSYLVYRIWYTNGSQNQASRGI